MKNTRKLMIASILLLMVATLVGIKFYKSYSVAEVKTYTAKYNNLTVQTESFGIVFRKETLVKTEKNGSVQYMVAEGQRVKRFERIALIEGSTSGHMAKTLPIVDQNQIFIDVEQLKYDILYLKSQIVYYVQQKKYSDVYALENLLKLKLDKLSKYESVSPITKPNPEITVSDRNRNGGAELVSPISGVVSFYIDGYEAVFTSENLYKIDYKKLDAIDIQPINLSTQNLMSGDFVYKIVDNGSWRIVTVLDKSESKNFTLGKSIKLAVDGKKISGLIVDVFEVDDQMAVVFRIESQMEDFQKKRKVNVVLEDNQVHGLSVYKESIIEINGQTGVYVVGVDNRAVFVPVDVIEYNNDMAIVNEDFTKEVDGQLMRIATVSLYDEVLMDAKRYKEGSAVY